MTETINPLAGETVYRELPDLVKRQLSAYFGADSAAVLEYALETAMTSSSAAGPPSLVDPTLTGNIELNGHVHLVTSVEIGMTPADEVGMWGATPQAQPQGPAPLDLTATLPQVVAALNALMASLRQLGAIG